MSGAGAGPVKVSRDLMSAFVGFARTGNPNNARLPEWRPYESTTRYSMAVADPCRLISDFHGAGRIASAPLLYQRAFQIQRGPLFRVRCLNVSSDFPGGADRRRSRPSSMRLQIKDHRVGAAPYGREQRETCPRGEESLTAIARRVRAAFLAFAVIGACESGAAAQAATDRPATAYPGGKWEPGPAKFGAAVVSDVSVSMDDGVVLKASIVYPTDKATGQRAAGPSPSLSSTLPTSMPRPIPTPTSPRTATSM